MLLSNLSEQDRHALTRTRLAAIVRSSADAIIGETLDGIITDWNPAAERLYGYTAEEVIGQHLSLLVPPDERADLAHQVARVRSGESIEGLEVVRWTKDGQRLEVSLTVSPVYNDAGQIVATSAIVRDISAVKAHERALAASEARFRAAFENASVGIVLTAPDERTLQVNQALCAFLGYSASELRSMTLEAITHPDDVYLSHAHVMQVVTGEIDTYELEKRYLRKDGQIVWALLSGSLVRDEMGAPHYYVSLIHDITERKAAEAELAAAHQGTREVLERITDGFYALDREWCFTHVNTTAERILGRTRAELLGQNIWQAFPQAVEYPVYPSYQQAMTEGVTTTVESFYPPLAGWFETRAYPSPNGLSVFFTDVTERKRLEQELHDALGAAQAANQATRQFLTMMSHELRTPMQAVMGYAELLLAGPEGSLTPDQAEDVQTIRRGARRLIDLVKQMLDLSRLEAGQIELNAASVDLVTAIEAVRQDIAPQAAAKALVVRIELPADLPPVLGDEMGVYQILLNLVGNAVKFTETGEVGISATATEGEVAVTVRDTGIGISAETLPHIFEEFRQVDRGMTRRYDGAGLGLTIARRLAERMGGRLSVQSQPEVGSTFTLHLAITGGSASPA